MTLAAYPSSMAGPTFADDILGIAPHRVYLVKEDIQDLDTSLLKYEVTTSSSGAQIDLDSDRLGSIS